MKSVILTTVLCAVPLLVEAGSLSHNHGGLLTFRHKRHAALTPSQKLTMIKKKRSSLQTRKTPGNGDTTSEPSNLAKGSYTAKQGCAIWHTVGPDEVCLGLIDKSSEGFGLDKFLQFNPSLNKQCSNLEVGQAYCVDTVAGQTAAPAKTPGKSEKTTEVAQKVSEPKSLLAGDKAAPQADADNEEDCEEEDEAPAEEDDEDCEEDNSESQDTTVISVKTKASSKSAAPQPAAEEVDEAPKETYEAPKETYQAPKETPKDTYVAPKEPSSTYVAPSSTYVAPSSTYVAPSTTYVAPTSTYQAPKETYSPEPEKQKQPENNNSGGSFQYTAQPATYYYQNGNPGSCGDYSSDSDYVVAVKSGIMGSQLCGKSIKLRNSATGKEVMAVVKDTCPTCTGASGIDLSEGLFKALVPNGDLGVGMFNVDYSIL